MSTETVPVRPKAVTNRYQNFFAKTRWRRILMPVRGYAMN